MAYTLAAVSSRAQRASRVLTSTSTSTSRARVVKVQAFKVTFKTPSGQSSTVDCAPDQYILNAAMVAGVDIPHSCKSGACCTCAGKIEQGSADQTDQYILDEGQLAGGFVLPCAAYPTSDMVILTHQEENLYNLYSR